MKQYFIKFGEKMLYGLGFGIGMGLSFKLIPINKSNTKQTR